MKCETHGRKLNAHGFCRACVAYNAAVEAQRAACRTEAQANSLAIVVLTESAAFGCVACQARKAKRRRAGIRAVVKGRKR